MRGMRANGLQANKSGDCCYIAELRWGLAERGRPPCLQIKRAPGDICRRDVLNPWLGLDLWAFYDHTPRTGPPHTAKRRQKRQHLTNDLAAPAAARASTTA